VTRKLTISVITLIVAAILFLGYFKSEYIAPYVIDQNKCGEVNLDLRSVNLSGSGRAISRSFPVNSGGDKLEEEYINDVTKNITDNIIDHGTSISGKGYTPTKLHILFVGSDDGISYGANFDKLGDSASLVSPWVRVSKNYWFPCNLNVVIFRQGRQIARDQMEMVAGRRLSWKDGRELTNEEMDQFRRLYISRVMAAQSPQDRQRQSAALTGKIPPEVIFAFNNSAQATIGPPSIGFYSIMSKSSQGYGRYVNRVIDKYFQNGGKNTEIFSVTQVEYHSTGYLVNNLR